MDGANESLFRSVLGRREAMVSFPRARLPMVREKFELDDGNRQDCAGDIALNFRDKRRALGRWKTGLRYDFLLDNSLSNVSRPGLGCAEE